MRDDSTVAQTHTPLDKAVSPIISSDDVESNVKRNHRDLVTENSDNGVKRRNLSMKSFRISMLMQAGGTLLALVTSVTASALSVTYSECLGAGSPRLCVSNPFGPEINPQPGDGETRVNFAVETFSATGQLVQSTDALGNVKVALTNLTLNALQDDVIASLSFQSNEFDPPLVDTSRRLILDGSLHLSTATDIVQIALTATARNHGDTFFVPIGEVTTGPIGGPAVVAFDLQSPALQLSDSIAQLQATLRFTLARSGDSISLPGSAAIMFSPVPLPPTLWLLAPAVGLLVRRGSRGFRRIHMRIRKTVPGLFVGG